MFPRSCSIYFDVMSHWRRISTFNVVGTKPASVLAVLWIVGGLLLYLNAR